MSYQYKIGDRVALNTKDAYNSAHTDGMLGTVERIEDGTLGWELYYVVLDEPIKNPDRRFFAHLSEDCMRTRFSPRWLRPANEPAQDTEGGIDISALI